MSDHKSNIKSTTACLHLFSLCSKLNHPQVESQEVRRVCDSDNTSTFIHQGSSTSCCALVTCRVFHLRSFVFRSLFLDSWWRLPDSAYWALLSDDLWFVWFLHLGVLWVNWTWTLIWFYWGRLTATAVSFTVLTQKSCQDGPEDWVMHQSLPLIVFTVEKTTPKYYFSHNIILFFAQYKKDKKLIKRMFLPPGCGSKTIVTNCKLFFFGCM